MRLIGILAAVALFAGQPFAQSGAARVAAKTLYFLRDDHDKRWCGYADKSRLEAQVRSLGAMVVGGVDYTNGRVTTVDITEEDETGDWAVNDEYTLDENERMRTLKRTINIIPGNTSEEQVFRVQGGKAIKLRSTYRDLRTGKPTNSRADWFEPSPVITSLQAFPFWMLIATKRQVVWTAGEACIPDASK